MLFGLLYAITNNIKMSQRHIFAIITDENKSIFPYMLWLFEIKWVWYAHELANNNLFGRQQSLQCV